MNTPAYPNAASVAQWERQGGAAAKARPTTVSDALRALQKASEAIDFTLFDASQAADVAALQACRAKADTEAERRIKPIGGQARAVEQAVSKWEAALKQDPAAKPALAAAAAAARAAADYPGELDRFVQAARSAFDARQKELEAQAQKAAASAPTPPSPERVRLRARVIDRFRVVKNRPDVKVGYLLCVGNRSAAPYLASMISDAQKPLLKKVLHDDTGLKFYSGEVIWEDGAYTFVGQRMTNTLARRIERGVLELTGTRFRIKAHE